MAGAIFFVCCRCPTRAAEPTLQCYTGGGEGGGGHKSGAGLRSSTVCVLGVSGGRYRLTTTNRAGRIGWREHFTAVMITTKAVMTRCTNLLASTSRPALSSTRFAKCLWQYSMFSSSFVMRIVNECTLSLRRINTASALPGSPVKGSGAAAVASFCTSESFAVTNMGDVPVYLVWPDCPDTILRTAHRDVAAIVQKKNGGKAPTTL